MNPAAEAGRRHGFLIAALFAGPLAGSAIHVALRLGALDVPRPNIELVSVLGLLLLAPVLEELVFRGGIQEFFDRTAFGRVSLAGAVSVGNVSTSILFAAAHFMLNPSWIAASVFLPSLVFGRLKQLYPSLLPSMLVHAWYNACFLAAAGTCVSFC